MTKLLTFLNNQKRLQIFLLSLLVITALVVRFYRIDEVPASLYIDEVDYGLQARSLIQTFADYRGEHSPFWVHSFNDIRTPIPVFLTVLTSLLFQTPELQIRGPSIFLGVIVVLLIFLLTKLWTKSFTAAFITACVFAFNPWQIQFSRFAHEAIAMLALYLAGVYFFYRALTFKSYKSLILSAILFSLSVYAYRTMSLYVPVTFVILFILHAKQLLLFGLKRLFVIVAIAVAIIFPFLYATTVGAPDIPRIAQLSITTDPEIPIWVQRNREVDSGDLTDRTIGKKPTLSSFFFHSKPLSWLNAFTNNYLQTFSTDFLFLKGDRNLRHSVGQMGHLYVVDFVGLAFGFILIVKNFKIRQYRWLVLWLLTSPVAASITIDGAQHAARLFIFSAPILLIVGLGWWHFYETIRHLRFSILYLSTVSIVWLLLFVFYLHRYFVHYPAESARYFGYGFKQAMLKVSEVESNYKHIAMVSTNDPPMIYYLFWSKTQSRLIQQYGLNFSKEVIKNQPLDKYKVVDWPSGVGIDSELGRYLRIDTLYLVTTHEFPQNPRSSASVPSGVKVVDLIKYPDGEIAFYLIARNPDYQAPPTDPKFKNIDPF